MNQDKQDRMNQAVDTLTNIVNNFNYDENIEVFYNAFKREHRTLQQSLMRVMLGTIQKIASDEQYGTDARNADTKKVCTDLIEAFDNAMTVKYGKSSTPYLPSKFLGTV